MENSALGSYSYVCECTYVRMYKKSAPLREKFYEKHYVREYFHLEINFSNSCIESSVYALTMPRGLN